MIVPNVLNELTEKERNVYITSLLYILDLNDSSVRNMDYVLSRINDLGLDESVLKKSNGSKAKKKCISFSRKSRISAPDAIF